MLWIVVIQHTRNLERTATCFQINRRIDRIIVPADYSCGRYQMIEQRLNQAACALLREFWAKDSLGDCQAMSEIDDNRDEIISTCLKSF